MIILRSINENNYHETAVPSFVIIFVDLTFKITAVITEEYFDYYSITLFSNYNTAQDLLLIFVSDLNYVATFRSVRPFSLSVDIIKVKL